MDQWNTEDQCYSLVLWIARKEYVKKQLSIFLLQQLFLQITNGYNQKHQQQL